AHAASPTGPLSAPRFDDAAPVPDDVFAAIFSPQAGAPRIAPRATAAATGPRAVVAGGISAERASAATLIDVPSVALADRIARSAPSAPGAGLSASLSSSPIAPALLSLLALPAAAAFDTRALFTRGVALSYLQGALAPAMQFAPAAIAAALAASQRAGGPGLELASTPFGVDALISR